LSHPIVLVASTGLLPTFQFLSCTEEPQTAHESRFGLTSLSLLPALMLIWPNYVVHFTCHKGSPVACFQFIFHQDPLILFCKASLQSVVLQLVVLSGLLCPRDRKPFISLHWTLWGSCKPIPPACWDLDKWQSCAPAHQLLPSMCIAVFSALHRDPTLWI